MIEGGCVERAVALEQQASRHVSGQARFQMPRLRGVDPPSTESRLFKEVSRDRLERLTFRLRTPGEYAPHRLDPIVAAADRRQLVVKRLMKAETRQRQRQQRGGCAQNRIEVGGVSA